MARRRDLTGQRFGYLTVISEAERSQNRKVRWLCQCDCGRQSIVQANNLCSGHVVSCGCRRGKFTHGMYKTRLYRIWAGILERTGVYKCSKEEAKRLYQERGITVCEEWRIFENFRDWALPHGYSDGLQIDRIDNDKSYCPENCRWVTPKENSNNRRNTLRLSDGTPLAEFCSEIGIVTVRDDGNVTKEYNRIYKDFTRYHRPHRELIEALRQDVRKQVRELYEISVRRCGMQIRINELRTLVNHLQNRKQQRKENV